MILLRVLRCMVVQGIGKALLWIALLGGVGYAAYKLPQCDQGSTCYQVRLKK